MHRNYPVICRRMSFRRLPHAQRPQRRAQRRYHHHSRNLHRTPPAGSPLTASVRTNRPHQTQKSTTVQTQIAGLTNRGGNCPKGQAYAKPLAPASLEHTCPTTSTYPCLLVPAVIPVRIETSTLILHWVVTCHCYAGLQRSPQLQRQKKKVRSRSIVRAHPFCKKTPKGWGTLMHFGFRGVRAIVLVILVYLFAPRKRKVSS